MATVAVLSVPIQQFLDNLGFPLAGGLLYSYQHGASTLTPMALYTDPALSVPFSNPIILDSAGSIGRPIYPLPSPAYDFVLRTAGNALVWQANNIIAVLGAS